MISEDCETRQKDGSVKGLSQKCGRTNALQYV